MRIAIAVLLVSSFFLAGCMQGTGHAQGPAPAGQAQTPTGTDAPSLPADIHDQKSDGDVVAAASTIGCDTDRQVPCFDYPIHVDSGAYLRATLTWPGAAQRMSLNLLEGEDSIAFRGNLYGSTAFALERSLYGPGDYLLRVAASGAFTLDVAFETLPQPQGPLVPP